MWAPLCDFQLSLCVHVIAQASADEGSSGEEGRRMTRGQAAAAGVEYRHAVLRDELDQHWQDDLEEDDGDGAGGSGDRLGGGALCSLPPAPNPGTDDSPVLTLRIQPAALLSEVHHRGAAISLVGWSAMAMLACFATAIEQRTIRAWQQSSKFALTVQAPWWRSRSWCA